MVQLKEFFTVEFTRRTVEVPYIVIRVKSALNVLCSNDIAYRCRGRPIDLETTYVNFDLKYVSRYLCSLFSKKVVSVMCFNKTFNLAFVNFFSTASIH